MNTQHELDANSTEGRIEAVGNPRIKAFIKALRIPHAGRRACILYGKAGEMSQAERKLAAGIVLSIREARGEQMKNLGAPECLMSAGTGWGEQLLKVLAKVK